MVIGHLPQYVFEHYTGKQSQGNIIFCLSARSSEAGTSRDHFLFWSLNFHELWHSMMSTLATLVLGWVIVFFKF